ARELLGDGLGALVPFGDSNAIAKEVIALLRDDNRRQDIRRRSYMLGREMTWGNTAHHYMRSFELARRSSASASLPRLGVKTLDEKHLDLPEFRSDHLSRMTDSTGIFQHAVYQLPDYSHGYCTDDNARALILTVLLEELEIVFPERGRLSGTYASFLQYAFDPATGRFRNFMSFERRWLESRGSEDSQGRALWALGMCAGRSKEKALAAWASGLFIKALPKIAETGSPRTCAFTLLGIGEYFRSDHAEVSAESIRRTLRLRLVEQFQGCEKTDWPWFEETVSYANARLPHALLLGGRNDENAEAFDIGLRSLRWLLSIQKNPAGKFRAIGSNGFYPRGRTPALFDQQPIEAHATVSACLEAFRATEDRFWFEEARTAFDWFLGRNDLGLSLYDPKTGGCCDGLHAERLNQNQGAESTLAYLIALAEMKLLANDIKAFEKPT
ncbi:MAG: glycosyl transferase family 1, partial [Spirochaetia bacterium]|nr:glycosyl transferase family 1 [Spirochaetia bacterium]